MAEVSKSRNNASKAKRTKELRLEALRVRQAEEAENRKRNEEMKKDKEAKRREAVQSGRQHSGIAPCRLLLLKDFLTSCSIDKLPVPFALALQARSTSDNAL